MEKNKSYFVAISDFPSYEINCEGVVRSKDRFIIKKDGTTQKLKGRVLSPGRGSHGYMTVALQDNGRKKSCCIHRLVAENFLGTEDGKEVNHKDGNKLNNKLSNLEWVTRKENTIHAYSTGLAKSGKEHASCKGRIIGTNIASGKEIIMAGTKDIISNGFTFSQVYAVANGVKRQHKGFIFRWESAPQV